MVQIPSSRKDAPSPSASFYDISDDEEGGYNTVAHSRPHKGVKLLYSKSKVYVHPTPSAKDNIPGFIALVQQKSAPGSLDNKSSTLQTTGPSSSKVNRASEYLLAWVPESSLAQDDLNTYVKVDMNDADSTPSQRHLVAPVPTTSSWDNSRVGPYAFSLPLSSIYSILVRPPSLGWWFGSVVINTKSGSSLPALFFHDSECQSTILQKKKRARESFDPFGDDGGLFWGGDEVVKWLKRYVNVERSTAEPSVYLIDPSEEDKLGFGQNRKSFEAQPSTPKPEPKTKANSGPGMDPLTKALKETRWKLLEQFSKITTLARRTQQDLANNRNLPPQLRSLIHNPEIQTLQDEFDSARLYLARWAMGIAEQSEREKRQRMFTAQDVMDTEESEVGDFEILEMEAGRLSLGDKRKPVTMSEWKSFFDSKGKLHVTTDEVKERIFHGGMDTEDGVRKEAWPFLLGLYEWDSSADDRKAIMNSKRDQYIRLKGAWWERMIEDQASPEQEEWWKEQKGRIEKDVHRTDRHLPLFAGEDIPHPDPSSPFYNPDGPGTNVHMEQLKDMLLTYLEWDTPPSTNANKNADSNASPSPSTDHAQTAGITNPHPKNLGYVQGMSDLLSPLYAVFQDDALAFWCFANFMNRMSRNFVRSQSGMRAQLASLDQLVQLLDPELYLHLQKLDCTNFFFFFRMLLVWYKREFEWSDTLRLWESLWTDYYSSQFHIFIAVAILEKHRDVILQHLKGFDEILKYINELSGSIDLQNTLIRAEGLFRKFEKMVQAIDKKGNFPEPSGKSAGGAAGSPSADSNSAKDKGKERETENQARNRRNLGAIMAGPGPRTNQHSRSNSQQPGTSRTNTSDAGPDAASGEKVITPELRIMLSRKIILLDEAADTIGADRTRASGLRD